MAILVLISCFAAMAIGLLSPKSLRRGCSVDPILVPAAKKAKTPTNAKTLTRNNCAAA